MFTNCYTARNGCSANVSDCGCNNSSESGCGCGNSRTGSCGCGQNLLGCACGGLTNTLYKIINGLDNTSCGCGYGRY